MNKSAKELFEELGYRFIENDDYIYFEQETFDYKVRFTFLKRYNAFNKTIITTTDVLFAHILVKELVAINQMVKELGWNE